MLVQYSSKLQSKAVAIKVVLMFEKGPSVSVSGVPGKPSDNNNNNNSSV